MGHTKAPVPGLFVIPSLNGWLKDDISMGHAYFQRRTASFRECRCNSQKVKF